MVFICFYIYCVDSVTDTDDGESGLGTRRGEAGTSCQEETGGVGAAVRAASASGSLNILLLLFHLSITQQETWLRHKLADEWKLSLYACLQKTLGFCKLSE